MYLIDSNIFLEILLEREKSNSVVSFFKAIDVEKLFMTGLSLHSIGIILFRMEKIDLFNKFINNVIINGIRILTLYPENLFDLENISRDFDLDFDDAYQYLISQKFNL